MDFKYGMIFWFEMRLEFFYHPGIWAFGRSQPFLWLLTICNRWKKPQVLFFRKTHSRRRGIGPMKSASPWYCQPPKSAPLCRVFVDAAQGFYHMFLFRKKQTWGPSLPLDVGFFKVISFLRKLQTSFVFIYFFPHRSGNTQHFSQKLGSFASWRILKLGDSFWICGNEDGWFFELCSNKHLQFPPRISYKRVGLRFPYIGSLDPGTDGRFLSQWLSPKFDGLRLCCLQYTTLFLPGEDEVRMWLGCFFSKLGFLFVSLLVHLFIYLAISFCSYLLVFFSYHFLLSWFFSSWGGTYNSSIGQRWWGGGNS